MASARDWKRKLVQFRNTRKNDLMIIKLPATITAREARSFRREVESCFSANRRCIAADFSSVIEIDSAALNLLTRCMGRIANGDGSLQLAGMSPEAATIFELAGMDNLFDMFQAPSELAPDYEAAPVEESRPAVAEQAALQPSAA
jgi:anti-anti-sigma factor